jgi:hypothetical protein
MCVARACGADDVVDISADVMQEAGGGDISGDTQIYAIAALTANGQLQKCGEW